MAASATSRAIAPISVVIRIRAVMEWLWLGAAFSVPLVMMPDTFMAGFIQMPKVFILRTVVLLLGVLWAWEWALSVPATSAASPTPETGLLARLRAGLRARPQRLIAGGAIAVVVIAIISAAASPVPRVSFWGIDPGWDTYAVYSTAAYVLLFLVVAAHLRTEDQLRRLFFVIAAAGTLAAVYGIGQHFGYDPLRSTEQDHTRAAMTLGNPIFAGAFLAMTMPITMALLLRARGNVSPLVHIFLVALPLTAQVMALLFTLSRGPWVGATAGIGVTLILLARYLGRETFSRALAMLAVAGAISMLVSLVPAAGVLNPDAESTVGGRLAGIIEETTSGGLSSRLIIWQTAGRVSTTVPWVDTGLYPELPDLAVRGLRPIIGYGPDMFPYAYQLIGETRATSSLIAHGHNFLVHTMVELGLLGVAAYLTIAAGVAFVLMRALRSLAGGGVSFGRAMLTIGLVGALVGRAGEQFTGKAQVSDLLVMWALLGVVAALAHIAGGDKGDAPDPDAPSQRRRGAAGRSAVPSIAPVKIGLAVGLAIVVSVLWWQETARPVLASRDAALADQALQRGDLDEGFARMSSALERQPASALFRVRRGDALSQLARRQPTDQAKLTLLREAEAEARLGLAWNPLDQRVWSRLGEYSREVALLDGGEDSAQRALHINRLLTDLLPGYWQALGALAWAQVRLGQPNEALATTQESLAITIDGLPEESLAYFIRGVALRDLGRLGEAVAALERSIALQPTGPAITILQEIQASQAGTPTGSGG